MTTPTPEQMAEALADAHRLDWAIAHPYQFMEIYRWHDNADARQFRAELDKAIAYDAKHGRAVTGN